MACQKLSLFRQVLLLLTDTSILSEVMTLERQTVNYLHMDISDSVIGRLLFSSVLIFSPSAASYALMETLLLSIYHFALYITDGCSSISMRLQHVNLCAPWIIRICLQNGLLRQSFTLQDEKSHA